MILAGNWKLNKNPKEAAEFATVFATKANKDLASKTLIFPTALSLSSVSETFKKAGIGFGLQNMAVKSGGAFSGENSGEMSLSLGATHVLIGHSERRSLYGETNQQVNEKTKLAIELGLVPVICIGETLEERKTGVTNKVLEKQLRECLVDCSFTKTPIIAYEPVWAIGTGEVATPEQANEAHVFVKSVLKELGSASAPVLYGGSVKPKNAGELSQKNSIDGFLVGGASLDVDSFLAIGEFC